MSKKTIILIAVAVVIIIVGISIVLIKNKISDNNSYGKNKDTLHISIPTRIKAEETNHYDWIDVDLINKVYYRNNKVEWWRTGEIVNESQEKYDLSDEDIEKILNLIENIGTHITRGRENNYSILYNNQTYYFSYNELADIFEEGLKSGLF